MAANHERMYRRIVDNEVSLEYMDDVDSLY